MASQEHGKRPRRMWSVVLIAFALVGSGCSSPAAPETPRDASAMAGRYLAHGDADHPVDLLPDGTAYTWQTSGLVFRDTYEVSGDTVTFAGESCDGAKGTYHWTRQEGSLSLEQVDEACAERASVLTQPLIPVADALPFTTVQPSTLIKQPGYNFATVDAAGDVYTTDGRAGFYKYHQNGSVVARWPDALTFTTGITVDGKGNIYVANFDDATIHKFDPSGKPLQHW